VKEVIVTPDDEIPEDHDMIESQEPPRMTSLTRESHLGRENLFKMQRSMVPHKEP
jgi:hypothetical protein